MQFAIGLILIILIFPFYAIYQACANYKTTVTVAVMLAFVYSVNAEHVLPVAIVTVAYFTAVLFGAYVTDFLPKKLLERVREDEV